MDGSLDLPAYRFYEEEWVSYEALRAGFEWELPERFNMASYICDRWATERGRVAVFAEDDTGRTRTFTFWQLRNAANQLANYLEAQGVGPGAYVGVNTPQKPETLVAHIAAWKLGAVSVPLSTLYGTDGLGYRLGDCGATACVVDETNVDTLRAVRGDLDDLETVVTVDVDDPENHERDLWAAAADHSRTYETATTDPEDDAMLMYTSGTTGPPKGVRHGHQLLLGNLPQFLATTCNLAVDETDVHWNVAEWTWIGSLFVTVFPAMYFGLPLLGYHSDDPFDAERSLALIERYGVSNFFAPPTALRMMQQVDDADYDLSSVRLLVSGGEDVGQSIVDWADETFGDAEVHEAYGQTEAHFFIGSCNALLDFREDKIGKALPGHDVAILDPESHEHVEPGTIGEIAIRYEDDPTCFKEYLDRPEQTAAKLHEGWLLTEDLGEMDEDGYIGFVSRKDDVIICSGYRIGPEEIEDCLASHDAVVDAGVIGIPDDRRGEVPKAYVVLEASREPSDALVEELQAYARSRLAEYEYPRQITFVDELPTTSTGKIRRTDLRDRPD